MNACIASGAISADTRWSCMVTDRAIEIIACAPTADSVNKRVYVAVDVVMLSISSLYPTDAATRDA